MTADVEKAKGRPGRYWRKEGSRFRCELCPRACLLSPGQRGFCFVRQASDEGVLLTTYGRSSGFCVDPIEKKPLYHFYPGTPVLSFGTAGCNLSCTFCQNWDISKAKAFDRVQEEASPTDIAELAVRVGAPSVAFTYNDPTIFAEYAIDTAAACRARGIKTVAVTNGYISSPAREELFLAMDAANIDLKGYTEAFYEKVCGGSLADVKETLRFVAHHTDTWLEVTTLIIPGQNDSPDELQALTRFVADELGRDVPLHFSAFHPDYKMLDAAPTPRATLEHARDIARQNGLRFVYLGNVTAPDAESTRCPSCDAIVVGRDRYAITSYHLDQNRCRACGTTIAGRFSVKPLEQGWGRRRVPVRVTA